MSALTSLPRSVLSSTTPESPRTHIHTYTHTPIHTHTQTLRLKNSLPLCFQNLNFPVICILSLNNFSFSIYHSCFDSGIFTYFCSCSATKSCWTLFNPMNCNTLGSSILQYLPDKNTRVGYHFLLQGIFPTQGSNPGLLYYRQKFYRLSCQGSPYNNILIRDG